MRLLQTTLTNEEKFKTTEFSKWLLDIGDGKIGEPDEEDPHNTNWLTIPEDYLIPDSDT